MPLWIKEKLFQKNLLFNKLKEHDMNYISDKNIFFSDHHLSHAASAFFPSPFEEAAVLTADGVGEWATTTVAIGRDNELEIKKEIHFPHSLGLLYSAFTYYTGFKVNSGEYKVMGLAPYGKPKYIENFKNIVKINKDGSFEINSSYFNYFATSSMVSEKLEDLFKIKTRTTDHPILQTHCDIAFSLQCIVEDLIFGILKQINLFFCKNLYSLNYSLIFLIMVWFLEKKPMSIGTQ